MNPFLVFVLCWLAFGFVGLACWIGLLELSRWWHRWRLRRELDMRLREWLAR